MTPMEVANNQRQAFRNLYGCEDKREYLKKYKRPKLKTNEQVRIKYVKKLLDRGYYPNWSDQTYNVHKGISGRFKSQYILKNSDGNIIDKRYYPEEVQRVDIQTYRVEKVLRHRKRNGLTEYFVKWLNYPSTENSWIKAAEITNING
jgi:hypothetical protein